MAEEEKDIPGSGAVFTFGRSRFADNIPSHFFIKNDPVVDIGCGDEHTAVVCQNGRVFVFGSNEWGQLGLGHCSAVTKPSCIKSLKPEQATHVACGKTHTIISTGSGKLFSCGSNSDGQLGVGDTADRDVATAVEGNIEAVEQLAAGVSHSVALNNAGEVFVWGSNADGQLGLGEDVKCVTKPTRLQLDMSIAKIACGYYHTVLLTEEGQVLVCGEGEAGKLGLGSTDSVFSPCPVSLEAWPVLVAAGGNHTLAVAVDGKVYGWGSNSSGQLGFISNKEVEVPTPTLIYTLCERVIKEVACGESHTAFVTELGELLTCGETRHGKLGCETTGPDLSCSFEPTRVSRLKPFTVTKVRCGGCHTMVLASPHLNTLQPPEVEIVSPPTIMRGSLPPLQRVPHINSISLEDKLSCEDSGTSTADPVRVQALPQVSVQLADCNNGDEKTDLGKDEGSDSPTLSINSNCKGEEEENNPIMVLKRQQAFDSMKSDSQSIVDTFDEATLSKDAKVDIKGSIQNGINGKVNSLKKSKMCALL